MNFVLRNGNGALAGYLMQERGEIRLRAQDIPEGGAVMVLMGRDGERRELRLSATGAEQRWPDPSIRLFAAYAVQGGKILFCTGSEARAAGLQSLAAAKRQSTPAPQATREEGPPEAARGNEPPCPGEDGRLAWPQRRWPPPPCCPDARYEGGSWRLPVREEADRPGAAPRCGGA